MSERKWRGYWINGGEVESPYFRKCFRLVSAPEKAVCFLCGLGWHELRVNGVPADDRVLAPVVTQFDRHVSYIPYDVTRLLRPGKNVITVQLAPGLYNARTPNNWRFNAAPWMDFPKMLCDLVCDGRTVLFSDDSWKTAPSAVTFAQMREGEHYDARLEDDRIFLPDFDDSGWADAQYCNPPGGLIVEEDLEPCRVCGRIPGKRFDLSDQLSVFDFGVNVTGWCEIELEAPAGSSVDMEYAEHVLPHGDISRENISPYVKGEFQTDKYTARGSGVEVWHARFTYHGFRYCRVRISDQHVKVIGLTACFIHNDFEERGRFSSSDEVLNKLQEITRRTYLCNYTGIPTDCPHREKNGWTGDAQCAMETGLWNFGCEKAAIHFDRILADTQRPSGQLPGVAPCAGWGYNWGSGPAWDIYLFEAPWQIFRFTGDDSALREFLPRMKMYVEYCRSMAHGNLVRFGLEDWCASNVFGRTPVEMTSSAYYYYAAKILSHFEKRYASLAENIRRAINKKFYRGKGVYADGQRTAIACALYFGIADKETIPDVVLALVKAVRAKEHKTGFGIFGAKYVPRVLAEYGYIDDAYKLVTQQAFPGWGHWVAIGATTLRERWNSTASQNHIMFGDVSAWMFEYLAGFKPGMKLIAPQFPRGLDRVEASYRDISIKWERDGGGVSVEVTVPEGRHETPVLRLPCTQDMLLVDGVNRMTCRL